MKNTIKLFLPLLFISLFSCEDELVEPIIANEEDVVQQNSEMFDLVSRIIGAANQAPEITCINFNYPITLFIYDSDLAFLNSQEISSDLEFSSLLAGLEPNQSISLSLPITATLVGGNTFSVSSYEELKASIEECIENDFLQYCNDNLPTEGSSCFWNVSSLSTNGEAYYNSFFTMNTDGSVTFNHENTEYLGTWVTLVIEDKTHLNINLEGNSDVALDWNYDWKITLVEDGVFQLTNENSYNTFLIEEICIDNCTDLVFEECEINPGQGFANFDLSSYTSCILIQTNITDPTSVAITFHETQVDAETNTNAISGVYTNTTNQQTIYVRIEDNTSGVATYVSITLEAISC